MTHPVGARGARASRRRMRRTLVLLGSAAAGLVWAAPALADTVLDFDEPGLSPDQVVNTRYATSPGVVFAPSGTPERLAGFPTASCGVRVTPWEFAASGSNVVRLDCGGNELGHPVPRLYAAFTAATYQSMSVTVGAREAGHTMKLIAFDGAGQVLAQSPDTAVPAEAMTTLTVTAGVPEIAAFLLTDTSGSTGGQVYVDDITLPDPPFAGPKSFALTLRDAPESSVVQGLSGGDQEVVLYRVNGSLGQVTYHVAGLPTGVTWSATPSVNGSTLRFTASSTAPATPTPATVTVTATPRDADTGTQPRSVTMTLEVRKAVAVAGGGDGDVTVPSCTPLTLTYRAYPHTGHPTWSVTGLPSGVSATIDGQPPASATVVADGALHAASLSFSTTKPLSGAANVGVALTGITPYGDVLPQRLVSGTIAGTMSPSSGRPRESLTAGTRVTITGRGLCAPAGAVMRFGNDEALAPLTASPDGTTVSAEVPRLATTGPVGIVPDPSNPGSRIDGPTFRVEGFRETWGMPFANYTPKITFANMEDAFGKRATHITANPCAIVGEDCTFATPFPDPWALALWGIAQLSIGGTLSGAGGACYGISRTVDQFRYNALAEEGFPPGTATTPAGLVGAAGPSGRLIDHVNAQQLGVLSTESLSWYAAHAIENRLANDPEKLRREVEAELRAGRFPAVSLRDGGELAQLHVVLAYDVTTNPTDPFAFDIWVYDSNMPFVSGEATGTSGATHRTRMENSRIRVASNGSWTMMSSNYSAGGGSLGNIVVYPDPTRPLRPTMPGLSSIGTQTWLYLTHTGSATPGAASLATGGASAGNLTQITSGGRSLLRTDGQVNTDPATALQGAPWVPPTGAATGLAGALLVGDGGGDGYRVTTVGDGTPGTQTLVGPGVMAAVTTTAPSGAADAVEFHPRDGAVTVDPAGGARAVETDVMVRATDGATLSAAVEGRTGTATVGIDPRSGALTVRSDTPGAVTLRLGAIGRGPAPVAVSTRLVLTAGERVAIAGSQWRRLRTGRIAYRVTGPRGTRRAVVGVRSLAAARARISAVSVVHGRRPLGQVTVRAPKGTAVQVTLGVRAGRRLVAQTTFPSIAPGETRRLQWRPAALSARGRRLVVVATAVDTRSGIPAASVATVTR